MCWTVHFQLAADEKWGDWRPHLSIILSNATQRPELDRKSIVTLGDTLGWLIEDKLKLLLVIACKFGCLAVQFFLYVFEMLSVFQTGYCQFICVYLVHVVWLTHCSRHDCSHLNSGCNCYQLVSIRSPWNPLQALWTPIILSFAAYLNSVYRTVSLVNQPLDYHAHNLVIGLVLSLLNIHL